MLIGRRRGDDPIDERGAESHARLEPIAKAVVVLPRLFVNHGRQAWAVIWHQLGRDDEHGRRIGCARESRVQRVRQPSREGRVDPEPRFRDVADDHPNRRVRRDVAHDVALTVRGERARNRTDHARPLERRAAGQAALDQREQRVLFVQGAGARRSFRCALHDDDATGARPRPVCRVDRGHAQSAQQHPTAELENALGQLIAGVGGRGPLHFNLPEAPGH